MESGPTLLSLREPVAPGSRHALSGRVTGSLTVEAWIDARRPTAEAMQAVVSIWPVRESFDAFSAYDAYKTDGLVCGGYYGATFDGRYVYFVPENTEQLTTHAVVLRFDTHGDFKSSASYEAYDAAQTSGMETRGYYGGCFDGRYVYFIPRVLDRIHYHSRLLRYDTRAPFKDPAAWDAFDIGPQQSGQGCAFDGRYLYICPGYSGDPKIEEFYASGVIRYDTRAPFRQAVSYEMVDLEPFLGPDASCFDGGAFDGRWIYFVPLYGRLARYDTTKSFTSAEAWQKLDPKVADPGVNVGAVFDGRWLYLCAYAHGKVHRFDTTEDMLDPRAWQVRDTDYTNGLRSIGFDGGFFDGRYVYFIPFVYGSKEAGYTLHGNWLRYDPRLPFAEESSWMAVDAAHTDGLKTWGFNGGAFDGRYCYAAPWRSLVGPGKIGVNGRVLRYDTTGDRAAFSLRWCDYGHNGGLCAAVPGPSFLVSTSEGYVLRAAAHRIVEPGKHHLVGTYDGRSVQLFIDGELVAARPGPRNGKIVVGDELVTIGEMGAGQSRLDGEVLSVEIRG